MDTAEPAASSVPAAAGGGLGRSCVVAGILLGKMAAGILVNILSDDGRAGAALPSPAWVSSQPLAPIRPKGGTTVPGPAQTVRPSALSRS
jgi:hypothetical protein